MPHRSKLIPPDEAMRLETLNQLRVQDTGEPSSFEDMVDLVQDRFGTPIAKISLLNNLRMSFKPSRALEDCEAGSEASFCAHILSSSAPLAVEDTQLDERFRGNPLVIGPPFIRACIAAPLVTREGQMLGAIYAMDTEPRNWTDADKGYIERSARLTAGAFSNRMVLHDKDRNLFLDRALDRADARYRALFDAMTEGVVIHGSSGAIIDANPSAARILGLSEDQLFGRTSLDPLWRAVTPDGADLPGDLHPAMIALRTGEPQSGFVMGVHRPDSDLRWILVNAQPITEGSGKAVNRVIATFVDITEQRRREALLETLSTLSGIGAWEQDTETSRLSWSAQTRRIYDADESFVPTVEAVRALRTSDVQKYLDEKTEEAFDQDVTAEFEFETLTFKGRKIWVRSHRRPERLNGKVIRRLGTVQDVTEERRRDMARQRDKTLLEDYSKLAGVGGFEYDLRSGALVWSAETRRIYGIDEAVTPTLDLNWSVVQPAHIEPVKAGFRRAILSHSQVELEFAITTPTGRHAWVRSFVHAEREDGRVRRIVGAIQDVTERKHFADRLQRSNDSLLAALDAAKLRLWEIDLEAGVVRDPRSIPHIAFPEGPVSVPLEEMEKLLHPDDRNRVRRELESVAHSGQPLVSRWRAGMPTTGERVLEQRVRLTIGPNGERRLSGIARDVTDEVQLNHQLELKRHEAEAASLAKSEFVARMSHEIRTPMNAVIGMLEVLRRSQLDQDQADHAATALKSAHDLMHLLDDVIDVSRLEARQVSVEAQPFAISALVQEVIALFQPRAAERFLSLSSPSDGSTPSWLQGDARRLRQVLTNLIGNAIKFTEKGGIQVRVVYDPSSEVLRIEVRDTGIGLKPDTIGKLFHQFYQADTSSTRSRGGSGLGLAICRQLVELMDGEIGVESEFGRGSTFWFTVKAPLAGAPHASEPEAEADALRPLSILVADDNPASQRILKALLESNGHRVTFADDGLAAVAFAASQTFDVILMDIMMPMMDGLSAATRIRELGGRAAGVPIIALTANALRGDRDRYLAAGMTDYLSKPIDVAALFAALTRAARV